MIAVFGMVGNLAQAQTPTPVTNITYGALQNGANVTAGKITYNNDYRPVTQISTAGANYVFDGAMASNVYFRRNTGSGNPNNSTVFYQYNTTTGTPISAATVIGRGDSSPTMSEVMLSNDLTQGLRNPFANGAGNAQNSNIERIDFYFSGGYTVKAEDAVVFFDLENQGNTGDGFRIAAFTSVDGSNTPTAYVNTGLLVEAGTFGNPVATPDGTNAKYLRSTTTNGDNLASGQSITTLDANSGTPGANDLYLVGILIRFTDLGLSVGQTIFGYSLMAGDVAASSASDLVNWNNTSVYLTNTDPNAYGNMDFMGFGAQISRPIPEPSTYGAMLLGAGLACFGVRRWRQSRLA